MIVLASLIAAVGVYESCQMLLSHNHSPTSNAASPDCTAQNAATIKMITCFLSVLMFISVTIAGAYGGITTYSITACWIVLLIAGQIQYKQPNQKKSWVALCLISILVFYFAVSVIGLANYPSDYKQAEDIFTFWANPLITIIIVIWASDTGAYTTGNIVGGAKLAPNISKNKTWSGAIGGLIWAMIAGTLVIAPTFNLSTVEAAMAGVITGLLAQGGDLAESVLKRKCGVKDSSKILAAHGGILDRIDSMVLPIIGVWVILLTF